MLPKTTQLATKKLTYQQPFKGRRESRSVYNLFFVGLPFGPFCCHTSQAKKEKLFFRLRNRQRPFGPPFALPMSPPLGLPLGLYLVFLWARIGPHVGPCWAPLGLLLGLALATKMKSMLCTLCYPPYEECLALICYRMVCFWHKKNVLL